MYKRLFFINKIKERLAEKRRFLQVIAGPRQVGKTTLVHQAIEESKLDAHYATADEPGGKDVIWIAQQWENARRLGKAVLILDEVQKIPQWSESVKKHWDEDTRFKNPLKVVLLGSSPLLVQTGLTESLAGRFELIRVTHWSFTEMRDAFGFGLDDYIYFGGYPGAADLIHDEDRWRRYINDSLVETSIARDVLLMTRVDKPALLRQLFHLVCESSGQILSYQKMTGQLQDAGNTTTLAHYLELLAGAGLVKGFAKFSGKILRQRASSPKLQVLNNALLSVVSQSGLQETKSNPQIWGRSVESAIGAHLANGAAEAGVSVFYWREGQKEVDFVLQQKGKKLVAIEVKSGRKRDGLPGMKAFADHHKPSTTLLVGQEGIPVEEFLKRSVTEWL